MCHINDDLDFGDSIADTIIRAKMKAAIAANRGKPASAPTPNEPGTVVGVSKDAVVSKGPPVSAAKLAAQETAKTALKAMGSTATFGSANNTPVKLAKNIRTEAVYDPNSLQSQQAMAAGMYAKGQPTTPAGVGIAQDIVNALNPSIRAIEARQVTLGLQREATSEHNAINRRIAYQRALLDKVNRIERMVGAPYMRSL